MICKTSTSCQTCGHKNVCSYQNAYTRLCEKLKKDYTDRLGCEPTLPSSVVEYINPRCVNWEPIYTNR